MAKTKNSTALVLSGGGALGAYEVGVIHYLYNALPGKVKFQPGILTGSSVGAINSTFIAANLHKERQASILLKELWEKIRFQTVFQFGMHDIFHALRVVFGKKSQSKTKRGELDQVYGIFDTRPLQHLVQSGVNWDDITGNIEKGLLESISIITTELETSETVVFTQEKNMKTPVNSAVGIRTEMAKIGPEHVLASSAIPIVFPAIRIGSMAYYDGGIRQNTPLRPALYRGAEKVIVISFNPRYRLTPSDRFCSINNQSEYPGIGFMLGKLIQAVLNDNIQADVERLKRFNRFFDKGQEAFGDEFMAKLNDEYDKDGKPKKAYRRVDVCHIQPSEELCDISRDIIEHRTSAIDPVEEAILDTIVKHTGLLDYSLMSFLFFNPNYIKKLIELGMQDAADFKEELVNMLA